MITSINTINSICILKDKRLVSSDDSGSIVVYDNISYKPQIQIQKAHDKGVLSLCVLRNCLLVSSSNPDIKIWRINENHYKLIRTLTGHIKIVRKVIELEDGRICSCSKDNTIKIWDNNTYQCITTITADTREIMSIIEINHYIISLFKEEKSCLRIWNKYTLQSVKQIQNVYSNWYNTLEKLDNNTLLIGGKGVIYVVDIQSFKVNKLETDELGDISCLKVIRDDIVLFGNNEGEIGYYKPSSNQLISKKHFYLILIKYLIENESNQLISCSWSRCIKIYKW